MNDFRGTGVPADGGGSDVGRNVLWVIRELGLPAIVKACVSCRSTRHHPAGKFRVNANGKLLDVWMLICCELCGRTSKIPVHERVHVRALDSERLLMFENNDPAMVRDLATDGALAGKAAYQLDWSGTWELETGMPSGELEREDPAPLKVTIRFELPVPIRVEKLLATGFGLSRSAVRGMADSGRIRLPMAVDAKAREDFTLFVITTPPPSRDGSGSARSDGARAAIGETIEPAGVGALRRWPCVTAGGGHMMRLGAVDTARQPVACHGRGRASSAGSVNSVRLAASSTAPGC